MRLKLGNGLEMTYQVEGGGAEGGRTALLLHGFTGRGASWLTIAHSLRTSWRLIIPDLLGHGESSAPVNPGLYSVEVAAAHMALLLDQVASEPVHLLGYSMGGRLALYFTLAYPERVRSLVLESASPGLETEVERAARRAADEVLAESILSKGIHSFVDRWEALSLFASQSCLPLEVQQRQRELRLANCPLGLAGSLRGMGTGVQPSLWDRLDALSCPVLLITGERDSKFLEINRRMVECISHASLAIIPQAGHTTHLEQPGLFIQRVREFWEQLPEYTVRLHP